MNVLTGSETVDAGKIVIGDTIKFGYYTQKDIALKEGQKDIDIIREFGDFIPLKKGRQISAQQLLERFLFDRKKQYDYVENGHYNRKNIKNRLSQVSAGLKQNCQ